MRKFLPLLIIVVTVVALGALAAWRLAGDEPRHEGRAAKPLAVELATARVQPMPVFLRAVGQVRSEHSVQIRPQVSGQLRAIYFTEGAEVKNSQRLFLIDPVPYETTLSAAKAELAYAKEQAKRLAPLAGKEYVTTQEYDNARIAVDKARAALKQAEINLAYTAIQAPIAGRTGSLGAKVGDLVAPGDAAALVSINQLRPILVYYNIPQQDLATLRSYRAKGGIRVFITHEDGSGALGEGELVFVDNNVNTDTGTVLLKARLTNDDEALWPGQYVGVRTRLTVQANAVVIPQSAVQTGQNGNFVYVVENGGAAIRTVLIDRQVEDLAVVTSGLEGGETVVRRAPRNLRPGVKVVPIGESANEAVGQ
ncbi:MAG: efflux RND transporter periplasmic adaptor subunit [Gammaproteobacteria bacterium]|nr:efflux RND transporter periplasmic adaptor subunit [Gammaproteobacteria bacterium]